MRTATTALLLILAQLVACSGRTVPTERYYRLPKPNASSPGAPLLKDGIIVVRRLSSDGLHAGRAMLYLEDGFPLVLHRYQYHLWSDTPPRLVQHQLAAFLRTARAAPMVLTDPTVPAEFTISGKIHRFEQQREKRGSLALLTVELRLDQHGQSRPLFMAVYEDQVEVGSNGVQSAVDAFGRGLSSIFEKFLDDVRKNLNQSEPHISTTGD